ncbi:hypothetical protein CPC08DRAFT_296619 [Agrocybe pediades]|nr:hypothetical protein CPC08DRAFT_296619 [Agrocybe pediades]
MAGFVSSDILQVAQEFPIFEFSESLLLLTTVGSSFECLVFLGSYLCYLNLVKDVCELARLVYLEQICQYCECVLSVLEQSLSDDWNAHFIYSYFHLLPALYHGMVPNGSVLDRMRTVGFGIGIIHVALQSASPYRHEIPGISYGLTGDRKLERIFALSASFCVDLLCDKADTSRDVRHISRIMATNHRKRRVHPWRWRQLYTRRSLCNQLVALWPSNDNDDIPVSDILTIYQYLRVKNAKHRPMEDNKWSLYELLLSLLPYILPFAGRYQPLVLMCREKCFGPISQAWPKKSRRARRAIDTYLQRMDLQETC